MWLLRGQTVQQHVITEGSNCTAAYDYWGVKLYSSMWLLRGQTVQQHVITEGSNCTAAYDYWGGQTVHQHVITEGSNCTAAYDYWGVKLYSSIWLLRGQTVQQHVITEGSNCAAACDFSYLKCVQGWWIWMDRYGWMNMRLKTDIETHNNKLQFFFFSPLCVLLRFIFFERHTTQFYHCTVAIQTRSICLNKQLWY